jgi:iron-sulfur cluster insertion protein
MTDALLADQDLSLTGAAASKMAELVGQVEDNIEGVRVFASAGSSCSGPNFGMTFTDQLNDDDLYKAYDTFKLIVDPNSLEFMRGVEIDFTGEGEEARFVFNNIAPSGGCASCGSSSGASHDHEGGSTQGGGCS